ncbi:heterokaryon incompatibility protein-domain-containing protein [Hypoxylon fuscum]|nr:heterokaryon incompatibility protein-domain-containing protein [Hypoxylon fuscum]
MAEEDIVRSPIHYICPRCSKLDFNDGPFTSENGLYRPVAELGMYPGMGLNRNCQLCNALRSISDSWDDERYLRHNPHVVYAMPSHLAQRKPSYAGADGEYVRFFKEIRDSSWLVVREKRDRHHPASPSFFQSLSDTARNVGCLGVYRPRHVNTLGHRVERIRQDKVDLGWAKDCISHCATSHLQTCPGAPGLPVPNLRYIDCGSRRVVNARPGLRYCALSYVWGPVQDTAEIITDHLLPSNLPETIENAISVSKELGVRYLWIDRYCIPQDSEKKAEQLGNMHKIYHAAEVTIVAAAGGDPQYGLPGISPRRPRKPQVEVAFNGHHLLSTGQGLWSALQQSKWMTRGWTFQEAFLSRRTLVFTDDQAFFECRHMQCRESISIDYGKLENFDSSYDLFWQRMSHVGPCSEMKQVREIWMTIAEYLERDLTHDSDALNAMLGILAHFEDEFPDGFRHIWGLPVFLQAEKSLGEILSPALLWKPERPARRRAGFPSWSWTGWDGPIEVGDHEMLADEPRPSTAKIAIELDDASLVYDQGFLSNSKKFKQHRISPFIHIEADTVKVQIRPSRDFTEYDSESGLWSDWQAVFIMPDEEQDSLESGISGREHHNLIVNQFLQPGDGLYNQLLRRESWYGIVLEERKDRDVAEHKMGILVVRDLGGSWERVGTVSLTRYYDMGMYLRGRRTFRLG